MTIEIILWAISYCYFVVIFYGHFLENHLDEKFWDPRIKYFIFAATILFLLFLFVYVFLPSLLIIPFFFWWFGTVFILIPLVLQFAKYPRLAAKFMGIGTYFFYLTLAYEVTALKLGWWIYPGEFAGWVAMFGVRFPVEEFIFWELLSAPAILAYYEFFYGGSAPERLP